MDVNRYQKRPPLKKRGNGFAIASLILGILSITLFCSIFAMVLSALSLIFGIIYLVFYVPEKKWFAVTGIVLSAAAVIMFIISIDVIMNSSVLTSIRNSDPLELLKDYQKFIRDAGYGEIINSLN